jgi:hypothetical protein
MTVGRLIGCMFCLGVASLRCRRRRHVGQIRCPWPA